MNEAIHIMLLLIAFMCVPTMLLVKPLIIRAKLLGILKKPPVHIELKPLKFKHFENEDFHRGSDNELHESNHSDESSSSSVSDHMEQ